jgi:hypothetical protein
MRVCSTLRKSNSGEGEYGPESGWDGIIYQEWGLDCGRLFIVPPEARQLVGPLVSSCYSGSEGSMYVQGSH